MKRRRCTFISREIDIKLSSREIDMKLGRCTYTSQEIVLDEEDLLTLILLRIPYRDLLSFKSVSKKWLHLITTPHFTSLLRNALPPLRASALFIQRTYPNFLSKRLPDQVHFVPLDDPNATSPFRNLDFAHDPYTYRQIRVCQSCNGLLLCSSARVFDFNLSNCYVYNPSTNHLDTLSKQPLCYGYEGYYIGFAYDPSKSPHYKVIAYITKIPLSFVGDLHIYSSETGTWKASAQSFLPPEGILFTDGVYWNGSMHWLSFLGSDCSNLPDSLSDGLYFNVDEERFGTFPRPPIGAKSISVRSRYFGESEDHLHVTEVCQYATSLTVYEMKSDYSGWFVKYRIDLDPIAKVFPEMTKHMSLSYDKTDYAVAVLSLIRRENFREDSFLVLEIPGKAIRYNLVDGSFKLIWDFGVALNIKYNIDLWTLGRFKVFPYLESVLCA